MEVFVVHHDLNMANNWWGDDPSANAKASAGSGLDPSLAFICPGTTEQLETLASGTGINVWSMFCQTLREDCDPSTDPEGCITQLDDGGLTTLPVLIEDPR